MRPRLLHLGYIHGNLHRPRAAHGFNEAEAFTPRIPLVARACRRRLPRASMRPRLLHLGYAVHDDEADRIRMALQ